MGANWRFAAALALLTSTYGCASSDPSADVLALGDAQPYPTGPYGVGAGEVVAGDHAFDGYHPGDHHSSGLALEDLYDPSGEAVNAILLITSEYGCLPCYEQAHALEARMTSWEPRGIVVAQLILDGPDGRPAEVADAWRWKSSFSLSRVGVFADPAFSLAPTNGPRATPQQTIIDPRTMEVVARIDGLPESFVALEDLADENGQQP
jgi:hypothetical protein